MSVWLVIVETKFSPLPAHLAPVQSAPKFPVVFVAEQAVGVPGICDWKHSVLHQ